MEQERITSLMPYTQPLLYPIYGQKFRIDPYEWNNYNYACTKLEILGCPLNGNKIETYQLYLNDKDMGVTCMLTRISTCNMVTTHIITSSLFI